MRLIDADELRKEIHMSYSDDLGIREVIDKQPTAYDVDKVIKQIRQTQENYSDNDIDIMIDDAVEFVKSGGIE